MEFSGQLFSNTFVNAAIKTIKSVNASSANTTNINNIDVQSKLASLLKDFP